MRRLHPEEGLRSSRGAVAGRNKVSMSPEGSATVPATQIIITCLLNRPCDPRSDQRPRLSRAPMGVGGGSEAGVAVRAPACQASIGRTCTDHGVGDAACVGGVAVLQVQ